jgi:3-hydroxyisobutyrate dehydrogenase-like beta-hydroxyacid dehydrogenase
MNIGFIGLGIMGSGMTANILKAGYPLTVHDLRREAAKPLLDAGASWADTPKAVAEASDIVFTSLPGPQEVEAVALGETGIIEGIRPGGIYIDLTTSSPTLIRHIYDVFKEKGAHVMDAPVSGGPTGAQTGRLAVMASGDEEVFQQCQPVLDAIGDNVRYTGKIGSGSICKLMHNCVGPTLQAVVAECLTLGVKAGVEPKTLWWAFREGAIGQGAFFRRSLPNVYFRGKFDPPTFALKLMLKDAELATSLGREYNIPMPIANLALQELRSASNRGWGDKDMCITMLLQEERAGGIEVRIPEAELEEEIKRIGQ